MVRVKVEGVGEASQRQTALEPAEGAPGLFGWNTIDKEAKEVGNDTSRQLAPALAAVMVPVCLFYRW